MQLLKDSFKIKKNITKNGSIYFDVLVKSINFAFRMNKKITIDKKTLEDFENKQDNHLIMIFENEIKDQM